MTGRYLTALVSTAAALVLLGGCTTAQRPISPTTYAAYAEGLKGSPALRRDEVRGCVAQVRPTPRQRETFRKLMNLAPGRDPLPVMCQRITNAIASGRLSYGEAQQLRSGQVTPGSIRILQAR